MSFFQKLIFVRGNSDMGQSIQDGSSKIWKIAFKKYEVIWSANHINNFQRLSSTNFTRYILEYFVPYMVIMCVCVFFFIFLIKHNMKMKTDNDGISGTKIIPG